jgi:TP901 family phage tail tape measure protein
MSSPVQAGGVAIELLVHDRKALEALNRTERRVNSFASGMHSAFVGLAAVRTTLSGALTPLTQVFDAFTRFDFGMSRVQSVTGATADEMINLREQAKLLGKTTLFSASQVADAQRFLGQAGFNGDQINKATPSVLNLALTDDLDLGTAAEIVANISVPFGIAADKLENLNDILAKTANVSTTGVRELGESFKYIAPVAVGLFQRFLKYLFLM